MTLNSDEAKQQLEQSLNSLQKSTDIHVKMQKDPLKQLGMAVGAGLLAGVLIGRSTKRTKVVKVAAGGQHVEQAKEAAASKGALSGVLITAVGGMVLKVLQEKILAPKLEELADQLLDKQKNAKHDRPKT